MDKPLPFDQAQIESIAKEYPTPFYLYDESGIRRAAQQLNAAFAWAEGFQNYYAVKACPTPAILQVLKAEGMGADASSLGELVLAERAGITGEDIMFTSNDTPVEEFRKATELGAVINFDDLSHVDYYRKHVGKLPELVSFRFNPGAAKAGNAIIGEPEQAKYGLTEEQMFTAYETARQHGATRFGLHTMVASNELNAAYFVETAGLVFDLAAKVKDKLGIEVELINLGGGLGIPYQPDQSPLDLDAVAGGIKPLYQRLSWRPRLVMESGRFVTGPHGYLVTRVIHQKHTFKEYLGVDANMANLMRPGLYGAYHHLTVLGKEDQPAEVTYDVVGSLCENNDKFAIDRKMPRTEVGDLVVIHDAGAHGHAMGFNYNAKLRCAELLLKSDGSVALIRRAETLDDYFATVAL